MAEEDQLGIPDKATRRAAPSSALPTKKKPPPRFDEKGVSFPLNVEGLVLHRWRCRGRAPDGRTEYGGFRVNAGFWRAVYLLFGDLGPESPRPTLEHIRQRLARVAGDDRKAPRSRLRRAAKARGLYILFSALDPAHLAELISRHGKPGPDRVDGAPDLFLYRGKRRSDGRPMAPSKVWFVEVKRTHKEGKSRYFEKPSDVQIAAIRRLREWKLAAGIFVVQERSKGAPLHASTSGGFGAA